MPHRSNTRSWNWSSVVILGLRVPEARERLGSTVRDGRIGGCTMTKTAIISVDGHVKASRGGLPRLRRDASTSTPSTTGCAPRRRRACPTPATCKPRPRPRVAVGSRSAAWRDLETPGRGRRGPVPERCAVPGRPLRRCRAGDGRRAHDQAQVVYNRWLADFCAEARAALAGQALVSFDDVDQAVADVHWAKEHGLGGIMMPALYPGGTFFFDPALDPVWAACEETGLPISQHGGTGAPTYEPPGFAAILTLAIEHSFFSGRSLWQMIARRRVRPLPRPAAGVRRDRGATGSAPVINGSTSARRWATTGPASPRSWSASAPSAARRASTGTPTATPASHRSHPRSWRSISSFGHDSGTRRRSSTSARPRRCSASTTRTSSRSSRNGRTGRPAARHARP